MRKRVVSITAAIGITAVGFAGLPRPTPVIVWNASASAPIGLYRVVPGTPQRGDLVLVRTPRSIETLAGTRHYLPAGVPLVKHIAAITGDVVCAVHEAILIDGHVVARQRETDRAGRPLPLWTGCRRLARDEVFLLNTPENSFDSRYFGPVPTANIIGRLVALWTE
jgi:conjugative transfer signal peptidase TraF